MTLTPNTPHRRSPEAILREARKARDMAVGDLIVGAVTGLGRVAKTVWRITVRAWRSMTSTIATVQHRRAAIRELQALDDLILKDIGISRGDIPVLVEKKLSAKQPTSDTAGHECEVTAFPDRPTDIARPKDRLRPAA